MNQKLMLNQLLHGGDYNPEQWLDMPEILNQDIEYLQQAHCNTVTLGPFAWSTLEPQEGEYHLEWLEKIINRLYQNGIFVILATPSGARPKWLADRYPEVLRTDASGHRNFFGARHNHCYTSPIYREKVKQINEQLAKQFGNHPAVLLWHISNEFGGECYCELCQQRFREWLKEKYGSIQELNKRWCTTFWSHTYQSFDQIEAPSPRGEIALHALTLDWKRFVTIQTKDFMDHEIAVIKAAGSHKPITTNMMYDFSGLDYRVLSDSLDIISWDNYPTWHKHEEWRIALDCGMQHDLFRSLKKAPFLLMESSPSSTNWQSVSKLRKPGIQKLAALQAVAHGSNSVLYFQIRQSRGASEKFHGAVIDHYGGSDTRVFAEVTQTGLALESLSEVIDSCCTAKIAILYEWANRWALEGSQGPRNDGLYYKECVHKIYNGFRHQGLNVDLIGMDDSLADYKVLAIPMGYLMTESFIKKVEHFVANGGQLVMTYWSSIVDENDRCYLEGCPHGLMDVLGLRSTEIDALYDGEENTFIVAQSEDGLLATEKYGFFLNSQYHCNHLCDLVRLNGAESLMIYGEDFYKGMPALTLHAYGKGRAFYICADAEETFYTDFLENLIRQCGLENQYFPIIPQGIEITERSSQTNHYIFIQNFNHFTVDIQLPLDTYTILYSDSMVTHSIGAFETIILKKK